MAMHGVTAIKLRNFAATAFLVSIVISGCGLRDIKQQALASQNYGVIRGEVQADTEQDGPVVVALFERLGHVYAYRDRGIASSSGEYSFPARPGDYLIGAFVDINGDGEFQRGQEHGNYHRDPITADPLTYRVEATQIIETKTLVITGDPPLRPLNAEVAIDISLANENMGKAVSLSDPIFDRKNYELGLSRPLAFAKDVGGGLMFLGEFDATKLPVIFVHGIGGGPTDFNRLIESIDDQRFQPWVLYYPSGIRLGLVSDYFVKAVALLQSSYGFSEFYLVAHSMGGLVMRSFAKKYVQQFPERKDHICAAVTVNSPLGGMLSAKHGVDYSPIVLPSWRDVATDSEFLLDLQSWDWPSDIPYYLVYSYEPGGDSDGVVTLSSQLPATINWKDTRVRGFENTHVGTLSDDAFIELLGDILSTSEGQCAIAHSLTPVDG
jgi:pimeloyl-ACP methyl ester carboxylesterase